MHPRPRLNRPRRLLAGTVLCALLLTQALGLMHRVWHVHGPAPASTSLPQATNHGAAPHAHEHPLERLFAQHHDAQDCKVFDQLAQADAPAPVSVGAIAEPVTQSRLGPHAVPVRPAQAAGYLARGPPGPA